MFDVFKIYLRCFFNLEVLMYYILVVFFCYLFCYVVRGDFDLKKFGDEFVFRF